MQSREFRGQQIHTALLYRHESGAIIAADMAFHYIFRRGPPTGPLFWIESKLDPRLQRLFSVWVDELAQVNAGKPIPYSVVWSPGGYWDANRNYVRNQLGEGLTCATFVISAFEAYGLPILDLSSWPKLPTREDRRWQRRILKFLVEFAARNKIDVGAHIKEQRSRLKKAVRFRPDQVAAAFGIFDGRAIDYDSTIDLLPFVRTTIGVSKLLPKKFWPKRFETT